MRSLIWIEIKFLLPWWAISIVGSGLPALAGMPADDNSDYPLTCLGIGCARVAARAFGQALPQQTSRDLRA